MRTVTAMQMRKHMGLILDEVRLKSETVIVERAGKPIVRLTPITSEEPTPMDAVRQKLRALDALTGLGAANPRSSNVDSWLGAERASWEANS